MFTRIKPFGEDAYTYWIDGIYKIVSYHDRQYHAYFIQEWFDNWGDNVEKPPLTDRWTGSGYWPTLKDAKAACARHAAKYQPSQKTINRAAKIKTSLIEQAAAYL